MVVILFYFNETCMFAYFIRHLLTNWVVYTLYVSGILHASVVVLAAWLRIAPAVDMLNGWTMISKQFAKTFGSSLRLPGLETEILRYCLLFFVMPIIVYTIIGIVQVYPNGFNFSWNTLLLTLRGFGFAYMTMGTMGMQTLYILVCHITSRIYKAFCEHLLESLEHFQTNLTTSSLTKSEMISSWKAMFLVMRSQMKNISGFISPADTLHLVVKVIGLSTSVYIMLQTFTDPSKVIRTGELDASRFGPTGDPLRNPYLINAMACVTLFITVVHQVIGIYFAEEIYHSVICI